MLPFRLPILPSPLIRLPSPLLPSPLSADVPKADPDDWDDPETVLSLGDVELLPLLATGGGSVCLPADEVLWESEADALDAVDWVDTKLLDMTPTPGGDDEPLMGVAPAPGIALAVAVGLTFAAG